MAVFSGKAGVRFWEASVSEALVKGSVGALTASPRHWEEGECG